jgi:hypothetical protein
MYNFLKRSHPSIFIYHSAVTADENLFFQSWSTAGKPRDQLVSLSFTKLIQNTGITLHSWVDKMKADKCYLMKLYVIYLAEVYWRFGGLYCFNLQSEKSVHFYQTSWSHTADDITLNSHHREYLKSKKTEDCLTILYHLQRLLNIMDIRMTGEIFKAVSLRSPGNDEENNANRQSAL